jgi:hypothetical protein
MSRTPFIAMAAAGLLLSARAARVARRRRAADPAMQGWDWSFYRPYVALAIEHRLPLIAANVSRADTRRVLKEGLPALGFEARVPADIDQLRSAFVRKSKNGAAWKQARTADYRRSPCKGSGAPSPPQTGSAVNFTPSACATFMIVSKRGFAPGAKAL